MNPSRPRHRLSTDTATRVLACLVAAEREGRALSIREVQALCHISSTSVVLYNLRQLERDGDAEQVPGVARGWRPTDQGRGLPSDAALLGRCLAYLEREMGAVGGPLIEQLRERLR